MKDEFRWMLEWIASKGLEASDLSTWWSAEQAYEAYKAELIAKNHRDHWIMLYASMNQISIEAAEEARQAYDTTVFHTHFQPAERPEDRKFSCFDVVTFRPGTNPTAYTGPFVVYDYVEKLDLAHSIILVCMHNNTYVKFLADPRNLKKD